MPLPESVATYVGALTFKKKVLGGIDEVDVLEKIAELCKLYETELGKAATDARQNLRLSAEMEARNGRIVELEAENVSAKAALNNLVAQVASLQQEIESMRASGGGPDEMRQEYERRYNEIKELSLALPQIKEDQEARARREADALILDARGKAQEIKNSALAERVRIEDEMSRLASARSELLTSAREAFFIHERALARLKEEIGPINADE